MYWVLINDLKTYREVVPKKDEHILEAIDLLLCYLHGDVDEPVEEFPDSGFTDDFGVHME